MKNILSAVKGFKQKFLFQRILFAFITFNIVIISGCISVPYKPLATIPQGKGVLYVYNSNGPAIQKRGKNIALPGFCCRVTISQNGNNTDYELKDEQYIPILINSGNCELYISIYIEYIDYSDYKTHTCTYQKKFTFNIENGESKYFSFNYYFDANKFVAEFVTKNIAEKWLARTVEGKKLADYSYNKESGKLRMFPVNSYPIDGYFNSLTCSPDGKIVAIQVSKRGPGYTYIDSLRLFDFETCREIRTIATGENYSLGAFTPDGKYLFYCEGNENLIKVEVSTGKQMAIFRKYDKEGAFVISSDGKYMASAANNNVILREISDCKIVYTLSGHTDSVCSVAITPDCRYILSGGDDATLNLWDISTGKLVKVLEKNTDTHKSGGMIRHYTIRSIAISPDGKYAVSGGERYLYLWDLTSGKKIKTLVDESDYLIYSVAFSPNSKYMIALVNRPHLIQWDITTLSESFPLHRNEEYSRSDIWQSQFGWVGTHVEYTPDGNHAFVGPRLIE